MFSCLFTLAVLVLADLPVDAAPMLNSDQNRMEETRKEHEEALKTYRELAEPSREPKKLSHREQRTALRAALGLPPQ